MFCPQCGTESSSELQYCRSCGANLRVIGKAVSLSEAIARSDRGPLPKIKEMMKGLKMDQVSDEISRALEQMNHEIIRNSGSLAKIKTWGSEQLQKKEKTARERREKHIVHGLISLFSGIGLMIFLYFLSASIVLKLPPDIVAQAPFEIPSVVHIIWLVGLIPALTGLGRILAGLTIRPDPIAPIEIPKSPETSELPSRYEPASVTERTTNLLS
jgi:Fe2+ transport system protein B